MIKLVLLLLTAGPGFRDKATSSISVHGGTDEEPGTPKWNITNVTYEHRNLDVKGKSTDLVIRKTETMEFFTSTNERPRHFLIEGFLASAGPPKGKPALRFEADGDSVEVWAWMFVVHRSMSIHETTELFDLNTGKRFLVSSAKGFERVGDQFVGYEVLEAKGVHGRLVLSTPSGSTRSEVTFSQPENVQPSPWGPRVTADREKVRLEFGDNKVIVIPITDGKLNGKAQSVVQLP